MSSNSQQVHVPERKGEVAELQRLLQNIQVLRDKGKLREVIKKVLAYLTLGIDVSRLFSEMVMACQSAEVITKKMVYLFLTYYARMKPDVAILAINTLRKDCSDADPMVRGLALRSLTNLHLRSILEYITDPLNSGLEDPSAYVRRTAVLGVLKVHNLDKSAVVDNNYINILYNMLRDPDSIVVCNCVVALNEIMVNEGGIVVNASIIIYLIQRLSDFDAWGKCIVLSLVVTYTPPSDKDTFSLMNILDSMLSYSNSAVILGACKCFLFISRKLRDDVKRQVFQRLKNPLLTLVSGYVRAETKFVVLQHILKIVSAQQYIFDDSFKICYCQFNDPTNIKYMKLQILPFLVNSDNVGQVIAELSEYVGDIDPDLGIKAIAALGRIADRLSGTSKAIMNQLLDFIQMENFTLASSAAVVLKDVFRKYPDVAAEYVAIIGPALQRRCTIEGRDALLWILGEFGGHLSISPYLIERECIKSINHENYVVSLELLHATMKLFFKRPPEMKKILISLLEYIMKTEEADPDLYDRAVYFYRLLCSDIPTSSIILNFSSTIPQTMYKNANSESILEEFNTLRALHGV